MKVTLQNLEGLKFKGKNERGHELFLDTKKDLGGFDSAPSPMETVLIALGGCTGMDVVSILHKMKVNFSYFGIEIEGERRDEHPKVFKKIHIKYLFGGENLPMDKLLKAIELSLSKYCSVSNMLKETADITYSIEIVPIK
ncbi:MAG: OsmC family protein [Candidatus Hydrothermales bacterium]